MNTTSVCRLNVPPEPLFAVPLGASFAVPPEPLFAVPLGRGSGGSFPPTFFNFRGKLKIPKSGKREEKETDHGLTTPPFPSLSFFTLLKIALFR